MAWNPTVGAYRAASQAARFSPRPVREGLTRVMARVVERISPERRFIVERNLRRVGPVESEGSIDEAVHAAFESYGRYWADSLRLPWISREELDARFTFEGVEHIVEARESGYGPLMVIPHLGGWEWAAFWMTTVAGMPVTAVVEELRPPELFEFFAEYRRALGMEVVPLGPHAGSAVARAVKARSVICLLADRDIGGNGVEVEFFGEVTTLPSGPALLALRTGAPLLPCAIYFSGPRSHGLVLPPIPVERQGSLREDVTRITRDVAHELEGLIRRAPEQWHVMEPNWPGDAEALSEWRARGRDGA